VLETFEEDKDIGRDGDLKETTSNNKEMELDCMDKEHDEKDNSLENKTQGKQTYYILYESILY